MANSAHEFESHIQLDLGKSEQAKARFGLLAVSILTERGIDVIGYSRLVYVCYDI